MNPLDLTFERLHTAGCPTKKVGKAYQSRCPAHDDNTPSLSISQGREGVVMHCHAGCDIADILTALNLEPKDLFDEPQERRDEIVATYTYNQADGTPGLRVLRYYPKSFRQQHFNGEWTWGAGPHGKLLYRLPQVRAVADQGGTVWVTEGEKDVEALERLGVTATCNAGGASKFGAPHIEQMAGVTNLMIVADRDKAGVNHARTVAAEANFAGIGHTIVLPAEGKDAADHVNAGHGIDEFTPADDATLDALTEPVDDWPDPIPLGDTKQLPTFPAGVLPDWMQRHADAIAEELQMPVDLPAMIGLACLSTICARKARVHVRSTWYEQLNLYICVAMPPSAGKSPAFSAMLGALKRFEKDEVDNAAAGIAKAEMVARMIEKELKRAEDKGDRAEAERLLGEMLAHDIPAKPRITADDATPEALVNLLAEQHGRIALLSTEGGVFDLMAGRYSEKANLDVYLKAWGGDDIIVDRIGRGESSVSSPALTIGITVQPSVIAALAERPELAGRGLTARFMYSVPVDTVGQRNFIDQGEADIDVLHCYDNHITSIAADLAKFSEPGTLKVTDQSRRLFNQWRQGLEVRRVPEGDMRPIAEWSTKLESSVIRTAGLLHIADGGHPHGELAEDCMQRAITIGDYWLAHAFAVHDLWGTDPVMTKAKHIMAWTKGETFSIRDLYSNHRTMFPRADDTIEPITLLVERGWLRPVDNWPVRLGQRGKASPRFDVHPTWKTRLSQPHEPHEPHELDITGSHAVHAVHVPRDLKKDFSLSRKIREKEEPLAHEPHEPHEESTPQTPQPVDNHAIDPIFGEPLT